MTPSMPVSWKYVYSHTAMLPRITNSTRLCDACLACRRCTRSMRHRNTMEAGKYTTCAAVSTTRLHWSWKPMDE
jgi:hypothetical protein